MGPPSTKRTVPPDSDAHAAAVTKLPRLEQLTVQPPGAGDFSSSVKKKLQSSSRTGQACDRCKVRKIRCDGRPEGCSPCAQNHTPCTTTDRITGRPTIRGQTEALEAENSSLREHVAALHAQLRDHGIEPVAAPAPAPAGLPAPPLAPGPPWPSPQPPSDTTSSPWPTGPPRPSSRPLESTHQVHLPVFKTGSVGDNYLGVSSADSLLSHIKGPSLSVFGAEIDITDFIEDEADYDRSVMSYSHFLRVILREDTEVEPVPFPEYETLNRFAHWFLRSLNPYTMLLDKPTFMHLIWRIGNEPAFSPTPAEIVSVHMMLATLKYQISVRNSEAAMMEEASKHYRYALSFYRDLMHGQTWQHVQALAMICHHVRNFPKPGAAWFMVSQTFLLAIELGLHRSSKAWGNSGNMDRLEIEMRKRIFWTLHALATSLSGKLGRPLPINVEDIDVEFPDAMSDCLPTEEGMLSPFRKCSFQVGIQTTKLGVWINHMYRTIYAVRQSPRGYEDNVRYLEDGLRTWKQELPRELADPATAARDDYIFALYLEFWDLEFQLLLYHPAVCLSTNTAFRNANLDKCLAVARRMLHNCNEMIKLMSLDITWINAAVYIAAIFTTLFISYQRRDELKLDDMEKLRDDMNRWIHVMSTCGHLLRTGDKLKNAVQKIVSHSLNAINDSVVKRTAAASLAAAALQAPQAQSSQPDYSISYEPRQDAAVVSTEAASTPTYGGAPAGTSFAFSNGGGSLTPHQQGNDMFSQPVYTASEDTSLAPTHAAALAAAAASGTPEPRRRSSYAFPNVQVASSNTYNAPYGGTTPNDWAQWSRANVRQLETTGDYPNVSGAVHPPHGRSGSPIQGAGGGVGDGPPMQQGLGRFGQWPAVVFPDAKGHIAGGHQ